MIITATDFTTPAKTTVVHIRNEYDIYIGRGSKWGNPFIIGRDGTRTDVIQKYEEWIVNHPSLLSCLFELRGKRLGCFCYPKECHGDVLAFLAEFSRMIQF